MRPHDANKQDQVLSMSNRVAERLAVYKQNTQPLSLHIAMVQLAGSSGPESFIANLTVYHRTKLELIHRT